MNTNAKNIISNPTSVISDPAKGQLFLRLLQECKALDPVLIKLKNSFADSMIIVTASSRRAARGLADAVGEFCHKNKQEYFGMEGYETGEWILVDCNDVIINIFLEETRGLYKLEDLWGNRSHVTRKEVLP